MMRWWLMAWRNLWRDARAGELRLPMVAVALGVAALSSVAFLADRMQAGMARDARQLLGGDVVVVSDQATPKRFVQQAKALGLKHATTLSFPTMARAGQERGGASRLIALKAVEPGYPLRGALQVLHASAGELAGAGLPVPLHANGTVAAPNNQTAYDGPSVVVRTIPAPGQAWAEPGLLEALELQPGDSLWLGQHAVRLSQVLTVEPDRGAGFMNFAPRLLINMADLDATGLVQPASRVVWRFAVAGPEDAVQTYLQWAQAELDHQELRGLRLETMEAGRPEMRQTLDRAEKFLNLVALLAALLSAVAVALAARGFAASHLDDCAIQRVLGQSQREMAAVYAMEFGVLGLAASLLGAALGFGLHQVFVGLLGGLIESDLPAAGWRPLAYGLGTGLTLLVAFGLPPVLQLARVPPLRVIRRDVGKPQVVSLLVMGLGLMGFAVLLLSVSRDLKLGLWVVGGFALAVVFFAALSGLAVRALRWWVDERRAPQWLSLATRQISARPVFAMVQVSALSVGLLALVLLVLLRTDLVASWRNASPTDAPNRFVLNVQPDQAQAFQDHLQKADVQRYDWYPMIRARLVAVNGQAVSAQNYSDDRAKRLVDREFNVSHSVAAPAHNSIVAGTWVPNEPQALSLEEGLANTLGLKMGDLLRFEMAGISQQARVTSIRRVDWTSMRANFFVMFPLAQMPDVPMT
ncbi:MAG: FtsX-like permease family protein, partial [Betaproteobacteria bacterium]|nr:FtsX-like permease family protein [Betaproteobacteria bacterium]